MVRRRIFLCALLALPVWAGAAERLNIVWPTPNSAYVNNRPPEEYVQPTVSGRLESAFFGCVRNGGRRFHEGIDLKPVSRNSRREATDPIYAVMDGTVVHINEIAGNSGYGRYVVLEHRQVHPSPYTLYAHLASVEKSVSVGTEVKAGQTIGIMGRSAGGYTIPKQRAHLHFEIGFWLTEEFQDWYRWKKYTSANTHREFNGLNMIGMDPVGFYDLFRAGHVRNLREYVQSLPVAFTLRVKSERIPDFVRRYPTLIDGTIPASGVGGWEIGFTGYGLPKEWRALAADDALLIEQRERVSVVWHDAELVAEYACSDSLSLTRGRPSVGSQTQRSLQLLFGFR